MVLGETLPITTIQGKSMSYQMPPFTQYGILGENRIFGFPQKYHVKTTQDTTQMTFRAFQAKLGPVNF